MDNDFNDDIVDEVYNNMFEDEHPGKDIGDALAFADLLSDEKKIAYDMDENTDKENWDTAMELCSLQERGTNNRILPDFEQYIEKILLGKQKGPWKI